MLFRQIDRCVYKSQTELELDSPSFLRFLVLSHSSERSKLGNSKFSFRVSYFSVPSLLSVYELICFVVDNFRLAWTWCDFEFAVLNSEDLQLPRFYSAPPKYFLYKRLARFCRTRCDVHKIHFGDRHAADSALSHLPLVKNADVGFSPEYMRGFRQSSM